MTMTHNHPTLPQILDAVSHLDLRPLPPGHRPSAYVVTGAQVRITTKRVTVRLSQEFAGAVIDARNGCEHLATVSQQGIVSWPTAELLPSATAAAQTWHFTQGRPLQNPLRDDERISLQLPNP